MNLLEVYGVSYAEGDAMCFDAYICNVVKKHVIETMSVGSFQGKGSEFICWDTDAGTCHC